MANDTTRPPAPMLQKETVATQALGEVIVCGLRLSQRIALGRSTAKGGEGGDLFAARLLAASVVAKDGKPLFTEDEWDIFGAQHVADADALVAVAMRLAGFDREEAKND